MLIIDMQNRNIIGSYHTTDGERIHVGEHFGPSASSMARFEQSVTYYEELLQYYSSIGEIRYVNGD